ncbi:MAG: response regulator [Treponema sp.]|jgi:signal transduction histidine kinase/CheY-like chemotaxis protein/HPt (histidine-containing phosphotransfer) domain-containing protein|nr:response regulator [Treponema sp.]
MNLSIDGRLLKRKGLNNIKKIARENFKQLLFVFLAFLLMVLVSYFFTSGIVEKQIVVNAEEVMAKADQRISANFRELEIIILNAAFVLQNQLDAGLSRDQIAGCMADLTVWLLQSERKAPGALGFYGYFRDEYYDGRYWIPPADYAPREKPWYTAARKTPGSVAFTDPYLDPRTGDIIVSVSLTLRGKSGTDYGVLALDMDIRNIAEYVKKLQLAEGGYGILIAPDFTFLVHPDRYYLGRRMNEVSSAHEAVVENLKLGQAASFTVRLVNHEGILVVVFYKRLMNGWYLGIATPTSSYYHDVFNMAMVLSLMGFILVVILCYFLIRLGTAKVRSDEENKSKSSFLARMSHEIRTPMNSILGMAELITRKDISADVKEYVAIIQQSGAVLLAIINDILDFSKIESGLLSIEAKKYFLASTLNDIVNVFRVRFAAKPINFFVHVDSSIPAQLTGDSVRIRQILTNLLNNAEKYTPAGYVDLEILMEKLEGKAVKLIFKVSDSGIGIKPEDLTRLFQDFTRLDEARNQAIEGTGLGLTITQSICHAMGGDVSASSEYGRGSVFTASVIQQYDEDKKIALVENPEQRRILLFEERLAFADSLLRAFKTLGISPVLSSNLESLLSALGKDSFDFAFVPSKHAAECIRARERRTSPIKLIIMVELGGVLAFKDADSILLPVYSISLANILNGVVTNEKDLVRDGGIRLTAPSARVLVVDDIATNLRVAAELLAPYRMIIDTSLSGAEAIEMIKENHYDLVFMDHMMPQMDGIQATAIIREMGKHDPYYRNLPIIALTANAIFGQREMFLQNGIDDFLAKPIEMQKLNALLERWIPKEKQIKIVDPEKQGTSGMMRLPEIRGVDVKAGIQNTGGSPEAYMRILSVFCRDTQERITLVKDAADSGDTALYTTLVHALKSACRSVGALSCGDFAARLEEAGNKRDQDAIRQDTAGFLKELRDVTDNILSVLEKDADKAEKTETAELSSLQLEFLKEALLNMDVTLVNRLITEYTGKPLDKKTRDFIADIEQHILLFDYEKAVEKLDGLL